MKTEIIYNLAIDKQLKSNKKPQRDKSYLPHWGKGDAASQIMPQIFSFYKYCYCTHVYSWVSILSRIAKGRSNTNFCRGERCN